MRILPAALGPRGAGAAAAPCGTPVGDIPFGGMPPPIILAFDIPPLLRAPAAAICAWASAICCCWVASIGWRFIPGEGAIA